MSDDHDDLLGLSGDMRSSSRARQSHLWRPIVADHGGIDIPEAIDLRSAQEALIDASLLQPVCENLRQTDDERGRLHKFGISNGKRRPRRLGSNSARFIY